MRWLGLGVASLLAWAACSATDNRDPPPNDGGHGGSHQGGASGGGGSLGLGGIGGGQICPEACSDDLKGIVDCNGAPVMTCGSTLACDPATITCGDACTATESAKRSIGCEYMPVYMDQLNTGACFAVFVANVWNANAHLALEYDGNVLDVESFGYIPVGSGPSLTYVPFDNQLGLQPGDVAVLFLAGLDGVPGVGSPVCPLPSAVPSGVMLANQSGKAKAFKLTSDVPITTYQINPYGGGSAAITGASLLLPTSAWDTNYIAVNAYRSGPHPASLNIVAKEDNTQITMLPIANVVGGGGIPPGSANGQMFFSLNAGEHAQLTQLDELTGSVIESDKPVGLMAGARCSYVPQGVYACDHLEQMIPPVKALGHEHVGVMHQSRSGEPGVWRLIGAVDGTELSWSADIGGPTTLDQGEVAELSTQFAFTVKSQDADHPFILMSHMSGGSTNGMNGVGDADAVLAVPPAQWLKSYVFFADPTYPRTNLVVIRAHGKDGPFVDVHSECGGPLTGWQDVGDYQYTRVDLTNGNFQDVGACSSGRQRMFSDAPFGVYVWGWGSPTTTPNTEYVSYGYPAGMNVGLINNLNVPPTPK